MPSKGRKKNQLILVLLFVLGFLPVIVAYWLYHYQVFLPENTTNHGELIHPAINLNQLGVQQIQTTAKKWRVAYIILDSECDKVCADRLYNIRQVHTSLGKEKDRVVPVLLTDRILSTKFMRLLRTDYPSIQLVPVTTSALYRVKDAIKLNSIDQLNNTILVIDPLSNAMLRYTPLHSGRHLLDDLKKLLRISRIG